MSGEETLEARHKRLEAQYREYQAADEDKAQAALRWIVANTDARGCVTKEIHARAKAALTS